MVKGWLAATLSSVTDNSDLDSPVSLSSWGIYWAPDETGSLELVSVRWNNTYGLVIKAAGDNEENKERAERVSVVEFSNSNRILTLYMIFRNYLMP